VVDTGDDYKIASGSATAGVSGVDDSDDDSYQCDKPGRADRLATKSFLLKLGHVIPSPVPGPVDLSPRMTIFHDRPACEAHLVVPGALRELVAALL
jgi:hypothetical protein